MNKKRLIAAVMALALSVTGLAGCKGKDGDAGTADNGAKQTQQEKVTPTFMYFISEKDEGYAETTEMLNGLQEEYGDKVKFNVINIDTDSEALKNFPLVDGNTPALIMLNTSNDISAMEFKCSDKSKLEDDIKAALQ